MKRSTRAASALATVAALGLLGWAFAPRPIEVETAFAAKGPFLSTIDEDGRTRLRDRYSVSAPVAGRLMRVVLKEGDVVQEGAVVAEILPVLPPMLDERTLREYRARWAAAQDQAARAAARVDLARVGVQQARNSALRTEQLASQGFVSLTRLEADRLSVEAAEKELAASTQERRAAEHGVDQARAALAAVQGSRQHARAFALRAPVSGQVLRVAQASETVVPMGAPVLELGDTTRQEVVAELLTSDAVKVRPGAQVLIERWGGPGTLAGTVRRIEPSGYTKVSALGVEEQRVNAVIDLTSPPTQRTGLGDGYRVGVRVVTLSLPAATQVPVSAVFPIPAATAQAPESFAVFRVEGGRARLTPVTIGARNGHTAWIQEGVSPGAEVIVYPPASLEDGHRIRTRKV